MIKHMEKENIFIVMGVFMMVTGKMINKKAMEKKPGQMVQVI
jgi:hypothetical protein